MIFSMNERKNKESMRKNRSVEYVFSLLNVFQFKHVMENTKRPGRTSFAVLPFPTNLRARPKEVEHSSRFTATP